MKVVINKCYGGFGLSDLAVDRIKERKAARPDISPDEVNDLNTYSFMGGDRADIDLIRVILELGEDAAGGSFAELKIVEIPDGVDFEVKEYDGMEHIAEVHRTWY